MLDCEVFFIGEIWLFDIDVEGIDGVNNLSCFMGKLFCICVGDKFVMWS